MLLYLDVETTGLEVRDRICSLGLITVDENGAVETFNALVKPPLKVSTEAMAVHHLTNEMLKEAPCIEKSETWDVLQKYNSVDDVLVSHNVNFELEMLAKEGLLWRGGLLDTMKCSKHLIGEIDRFSLQYLRYELGLYRSEQEEAEKVGVTLIAHNALSDAFHTKMLHAYLTEMADDERLMELSVTPVLIKKLNFGKYKGHYLEEVAMQDAGYLQWLFKQEIDEDLTHSINVYLKGL